MSVIHVVNEAFREIEKEELVVRRARMSRATYNQLRKEGGGFIDLDHIWTARISIDETVPYGEVDLSPDEDDAFNSDGFGLSEITPRHDEDFASGTRKSGAGVYY